jgi:hypothetical protein
VCARTGVRRHNEHEEDEEREEEQGMQGRFFVLRFGL